MKRVRTLTLAVSAALLLAAAIGSPAYAFTTLKQTGNTGDWGSQGGATEAMCGYSAQTAAGAQLHWIKVFPFVAGPASGHSTQQISWTVSVQRSANNGSTWKTVATSKAQVGKATQAASPKFSTVRLSVKGKLNQVYRVVGVLKWLSGGATSGLVKVAMTDYGVKFGATNSDVVFDVYCPGFVFD